MDAQKDIVKKEKGVEMVGDRKERTALQGEETVKLQGGY